MIGSFGDAEVFSFHATKFFNTFEGGAVVTNDDELAASLRLMKNFGFVGYDHVVSLGTNGKMSEISAAMGITGLESLDAFVAANLSNYQAYRDGLRGIPGIHLMEYDETEQKLEAVHHPFTAPMDEDLPFLHEHPERARARAYDIVLNGIEIGGGSVRIHNAKMQDAMFKILGISRQEADHKFGFFLEALKYGAPPHAGIALGFDRLVAIMSGVDSIREVIAFPKTQRATCPLTDAPSRVEETQLQELGLSLL